MENPWLGEWSRGSGAGAPAGIATGRARKRSGYAEGGTWLHAHPAVLLHLRRLDVLDIDALVHRVLAPSIGHVGMPLLPLNRAEASSAGLHAEPAHLRADVRQELLRQARRDGLEGLP